LISGHPVSVPELTLSETRRRPYLTNAIPSGCCPGTGIVWIAVFVMERTIDMQINPDPAKLKSLIDINCNLAAGLSGRG